MKSHVWFTLAALAWSLISFNAACAVDMFIKIKDIEGESVKPGHEGEIDILAWSWGSHHSSISRPNGPTRYSGTATNMDMTFSKKMDASSSDLFLACNNGKHLGDVFIMSVDESRKLEPYLTIMFFDATCTSYSVSSSGEDPVPTENVTLNFSKIEFKYQEQKDDGSQGGNVELGYDLAKGKKV